MPLRALIRSLQTLGLLALGICLSAQGTTRVTTQVTTVVLLRHAERQSLLDGDSPLAPMGIHRAEALVPLLEAFRPTVLYASDLKRTQQTLAPLASALGLKPVIRSKEASESLASDILREQRGQTVIVCWHHDLMKKVVRTLGVKGAIPYWSLDTYDRLWIVRVSPSGEATLEDRRQDLAPGLVGLSQSH